MKKKQTPMVWVTMKVPAEVRRSLDLLLARLSKDGLKSVPEAVRHPRTCPACGKSVFTSAGSEFITCGCGFSQSNVTDETQISLFLALSMSVTSLAASLSGSPARAPVGDAKAEDDGRAAPARVMDAVRKAGAAGMTATEIREALGLTPSNASTTVSVLSRAGKVADSGRKRARSTVWVAG